MAQSKRTNTTGPDMKDRSKDQFEEWAGSYDRSLLNHFLFRPSHVMLMEEIARWYTERQKPLRVLDVGCGTGTLAALLARSPWPVKVVGLDYAANMCTTATRKAQSAAVAHRTRFINGDSEILPFPESSFDLVTCSNSFHHYPNQLAVVTDMHRVLTSDGRLIIIDGFRDCVIGWAVYDVIINRIEREVHHAPWPVMHDYFETAGLRNIRRRKFNFLFPAFATIGDKQ